MSTRDPDDKASHPNVPPPTPTTPPPTIQIVVPPAEAVVLLSRHEYTESRGHATKGAQPF